MKVIMGAIIEHPQIDTYKRATSGELFCVSFFLDHNEGGGGSPKFGHGETKEKVLGGEWVMFSKRKRKCIALEVFALYTQTIVVQ